MLFFVDARFVFPKLSSVSVRRQIGAEAALSLQEPACLREVIRTAKVARVEVLDGCALVEEQYRHIVSFQKYYIKLICLQGEAVNSCPSCPMFLHGHLSLEVSFIGRGRQACALARVQAPTPAVLRSSRSCASSNVGSTTHPIGALSKNYLSLLLMRRQTKKRCRYFSFSRVAAGELASKSYEEVLLCVCVL